MNDYSIIPLPFSIQCKSGFFQCSGLPNIEDESSETFKNEAAVFSAQIRPICDNRIDQNAKNVIRLKKTDLADEPLLQRSDESYKLQILSEEIIVSAATGKGIFRGLQVLRQLFLSGYNNGALFIPCGIIEDSPRFPWRGFMLDCSRHFYTPAFIKKLLDSLCLVHINIFHWHLTDDQGWRLPVDPYPLLTEIGSKRPEHRLNNKFFGGYYSKEDILDIVAFAAERHIEVVPEVDLPGHASAILAAYPGLGCTGGPYRVEDRFGIFEDVLCAGNDEIFILVEKIFDSLVDLFPSKYVHIGGDEVLFNRWKECPKCQERLAELHLTEPAELQSWITSRFVQMLKERGKTAIGWDEVLENTEKFPLPDDLIVMSWRGQEGGRIATGLGHRVIMTPQTNGCYLDHKPIDRAEEPGRLGVGTIAQGFRLNVVTPEMDEAASSLVLGGQGNLWSEVIYADKIAEYMIFPRICGIAEALWSQKNNMGGKEPDIADFAKRLAVHQLRLDKLGLLQYRGPLE